MRRLILKLHAYLGLFSVPFLIIIALSSLDFNHEFSWLRKTETDSEIWNTTIDVSDSLNDRDLANAINDSLDVMGWYIPWDSERDSSGIKYNTVHFGKDFKISYHFKNNRVSVTSSSKPPAEIIRGMHFLGESMPNAPGWINLWQYYMDLAVYSMIFWVVTGLYLWLTKSSDKKTSNLVLLLMTLLSVFIMIYIWLIG